MCTLHLWFQLFPDVPVLFAANRDEDLDRPWDPPGWLSANPAIFGPRDRQAGGTWLGVNNHGVLVSLANHQGTLAPPGGSGPCSRGEIVWGALQCASARDAARFVVEAAPACKAYNLLVADPHEAFVVDHAPGEPRLHRLDPGPHVVTNARFADGDDAKAARSIEAMNTLTRAACVPDPGRLFELLSDHQTIPGAPTALCVHPDGKSRFGTSSASVVALGMDGTTRGFWFAPGPPCATAWRAAVTGPRTTTRAFTATTGAGQGSCRKAAGPLLWLTPKPS